MHNFDDLKNLINKTSIKQIKIPTIIESNVTDSANTNQIDWKAIVDLIGRFGGMIPGVGAYLPLITKAINIVEELKIPGHDKKSVVLDIIREAVLISNVLGRTNLDPEVVAKDLSPIIDIIVALADNFQKQ